MTTPSNYVTFKTGFLTPEDAKANIQSFVTNVVEEVKDGFGITVDPIFYCSTKQSGLASEKGTAEGLYGYTFVATRDVQLANLMRGLMPDGSPNMVEVEVEEEVKLPRNAWNDQGDKVQIVKRKVMREEPLFTMVIAYGLDEQIRVYEDILNAEKPGWTISGYSDMEGEDKLSELEEVMTMSRIAFDPTDDIFDSVASLTSDEMLKPQHFEEVNRYTSEIDRFSGDKLTFFLRGKTPVKIDGVKVKIETTRGKRFLNENGRIFPIDNVVVKLSDDESEAVIDQHGFINGQEGERFIHGIVDKFTFNREIPHVSIIWNTRDGVSTGFANVSFKPGSNNAVYAVTQTRFMKISPPDTTARVILTSKLSKIQSPRPQGNSSRNGSSSRGGSGRGSSSRGRVPQGHWISQSATSRYSH